MRADIARRAGAVLGLVLLALVAWRLVQYRAQFGDVAVLSGGLMHAGPSIAVALAAALLAQAAFATGWHRLLANPATPGTAGGWRRDAARWSISLGGKYLPGKVFQAVLRLGAYRGQAPGAIVAPALLREMLLSLGAACAWVALHAMADASAPRALGWIAGVAAFVLPLAALPAPWRALHAAARRALPRSEWLARAEAPGTPARTLVAWAWQLAGYLLLGLSVAALARAIAPGHALGWLACTGALCFAGIAGVAAFVVPAGIGVREAALAWYLSAWLAPGPAALLALAARVVLTLAEFAAIAFGLWQLRIEARAAAAANGDIARHAA